MIGRGGGGGMNCDWLRLKAVEVELWSQVGEGGSHDGQSTFL